MNNPIERRHFLIRALSNHNITQEQYNKEMPALKKQIEENIQTILAAESIKLKENCKKIKETIHEDGNMKRAVGRILITMLSEIFDDSEVKGCLRQGYRIMRQK